MLEGLSCTVIRLSVGLQRVQDLGLVETSGSVCIDRAAVPLTLPPYARRRETHLNRLMSSKISSCETSGNFLRKRRASMMEMGWVARKSLGGESDLGIDGDVVCLPNLYKA